jgi:hypothetical protein
MAEHLTVSSELVPFQEIDVYAKEAGYVKTLNVDYGSHVHKGAVTVDGFPATMSGAVVHDPEDAAS